tara:strand:- start:3249 stop:4052 length:804 start_codon:yes stop_codon:yes gene_type:complete
MIDLNQSKDQLFKQLLDNKDLLIADKKKTSKTKNVCLGFYNEKTGAVKGLPNMEDDYIYPVISNTNYFDSHQDVHLNGSMNKTAKDQNRKVYYVADHNLSVDAVIATPKNVEVMMTTVKWSDLGFKYEGETEALIFKIAKNKIIHEKFLKMVNAGDDLQNSIRMEYVNIAIGINSTDEEYKDEKKVYDEVFNQVANKESMSEVGFCWAVRELKLKMEGSAVLFGSNDATPIQSKDNAQPSDDTEQNKNAEPSDDTQTSKINIYTNFI